MLFRSTIFRAADFVQKRKYAAKRASTYSAYLDFIARSISLQIKQPMTTSCGLPSDLRQLRFGRPVGARPFCSSWASLGWVGSHGLGIRRPTRSSIFFSCWRQGVVVTLWGVPNEVTTSLGCDCYGACGSITCDFEALRTGEKVLPNICPFWMGLVGDWSSQLIKR